MKTYNKIPVNKKQCSRFICKFPTGTWIARRANHVRVFSISTEEEAQVISDIFEILFPELSANPSRFYPDLELKELWERVSISRRDKIIDQCAQYGLALDKYGNISSDKTELERIRARIASRKRSSILVSLKKDGFWSAQRGGQVVIVNIRTEEEAQVISDVIEILFPGLSVGAFRFFPDKSLSDLWARVSIPCQDRIERECIRHGLQLADYGIPPPDKEEVERLKRERIKHRIMYRKGSKLLIPRKVYDFGDMKIETILPLTQEL